MNTSHICIKSIDEVTPFVLLAHTPKFAKKEIVEAFLNTSRYKLLGFVDRTNNVILEERFYNVRDESGHFVPIVGS
jgi:hypothetical protein